MKKASLSFWSLEGSELGLGNAALLNLPLTAFFASRRCPGTAIRAAMSWAIEQARSRNPVISGFHSPLEQSVLEVLLTAHSPCVMVIARNLERAKLPPAWVNAIDAGTSAVVSMSNSTCRLTTALAARRNDWIVARSSHIVVGHASAAGELQRQMERWRQGQMRIDGLT